MEPVVPQISIVVPAYNEEENIRILSERLVSILEAMARDYEIWIIDDGSRDHTWEAIEVVNQRNPRIRGLKLSRNFGHQNALLAGLHAARGAAVVTMDADLQHPAEVIPELIHHWEKGYKIVNTLRTETDRESLPKRLTSRSFYRVFSWLSGSSLREGMSDFRLLDREVVEILRQFNEPHVFLRGLVQWMGFRSCDVTFTAPARQKGHTKYSWRRMVDFALVGLTSFSILPLRLSIL
ncbi:MAG: glycosyltransferase family 2 protein, partial [Vicinamibacteria bacterium]